MPVITICAARLLPIATVATKRTGHCRLLHVAVEAPWFFNTSEPAAMVSTAAARAAERQSKNSTVIVTVEHRVPSRRIERQIVHDHTRRVALAFSHLVTILRRQLRQWHGLIAQLVPTAAFDKLQHACRQCVVAPVVADIHAGRKRRLFQIAVEAPARPVIEWLVDGESVKQFAARTIMGIAACRFAQVFAGLPHA